MSYKKRQTLSVAFCSVMAILGIIAIIGNSFAWSSYELISQFLNQATYEVVNTGDGTSTSTANYTSDYADMYVLQEDETKFAMDVQSEGAVLLQNTCLPLAPNSRVTLLGADSAEANFFIVGGGSGSIDTSKTPSLMTAFTDAGYEVNETMWMFYEEGDGVSSYAADNDTEPSVSLFTSAELNSFKDYNDAAIIFIGRTGSESTDVRTQLVSDENRSKLEFSPAELELIDLATDNFEKVVVVLNTMNPMELGVLADRNVSVIWVGAGGQQGVRAIPEILDGTRYPSGRLVDTYAYDLFSAPAMQNFGNFDLSTGDKYYNYAEGIYVGYKYYETRYADKVNDVPNVGDFDYATQVQYPFGFGLSYATFAYSDYSVSEAGDAFTVSVTVTNTSDTYSGKEAVQVYMQSPYTDYDRQNGIEKSAVQLVGFTKTGELAPGASETVQVSVPKKLMRTYDPISAKTYIVDAGDYYFSVGHDVHDALNNILAAQGLSSANGMTADGDSSMTYCYTQAQIDTTTYSTGVDGSTLITNQFEDVDYRSYDDTFQYLTRSDWVGTFPVPLGGAEHQMDTNALIDAALEPVFPEISNATMPTTGASNGLTLADLTGVDFNDEKWDQLLDQMTPSEMMKLVSTGGWGTAAVPSINKPATVDRDGPSGISSTMFGGAGSFGYPVESVLASSWNIDYAKRMGYFIGEDGLLTGVAGWYAPAVNIHRTPFSGRNFEYYSEDTMLSGAFGAAVTKEAQDKGMYCYVKHFALNDQETNRTLVITWADEQTIREIYLAPFEDTIVDGGATALMTSMNRVGCVWSGAHKGLCNNVLRDEWGFVGMVITDAATVYYPAMNLQAGMDAGNDMWLCPMEGTYTVDNYASNASVVSQLRQASHRILYAITNSLIMNSIDSNTQIVNVTPLWAKLLIAANVTIGVLFACSVLFLILTIKKRAHVDWAAEKAILDSYQNVAPNSTYGMVNAANIIVAVVGLVVEIIGSVVFSKPTSVGVNLAISPIMYVGLVIAAVGLVASIVISIVYDKKKVRSKLATVAIWVGIIVVVAAIAILALTILLPALNPANG